MNRRTIAGLIALALVGCGGGSDGDSNPSVDSGVGDASGDGGSLLPGGEPSLAAPTAVEPDDGGAVAASGGTGLVLQLDPACGAAGETVALRLRSRDATVGLDDGDADGFGLNVSAYARVETAGGAAVELVSRDDAAVRVNVPEPGIAGVTARVDAGSVTRYVAAYPADAPTEAVLLQRVAGGACFLSLRLSDYCGTIRPSADDFRLGVGDRVIEGAGCGDLTNPNGYPVIETN